MPTRREIDAARSPAGGWTRKQLAQWGVPWPPPKGWKDRLIEESGEDEGSSAAAWTMPARFAGTCWYCGQGFAAGEEITMFGRDEKVWGHPDPCWVAWRRTDLGLDR